MPVSERLHDPFFAFDDLIVIYRDSRKQIRGAIPNGDIPNFLCVSISLCYFAGGDPLYITLSHGVNRSTIYNSIWRVIDAMNGTEKFNICFPQTHEEQVITHLIFYYMFSTHLIFIVFKKKVERDFKEKSMPEFLNYVGTIDNILVWIQKLDHNQSNLSQFLCGQKYKFGLNMQCVCDANWKFLDVSIKHRGATSDYLAFMTSELN